MTAQTARTPSTMIRARALTGFQDVVLRLGGKPDALLKACGIPRAPLSNPESAIPVADVAHLLDRAASTLDAPDLGLQLAEQQDLSVIGTIALVVRNSATLADAFGVVVRNIQYHNPGASLVVEADSDAGYTRLRHDVGLAEEVPRRQSVELAYGVLYRFIQLTSNVKTEDWRLGFRHKAGMPARLYRKHFRCRVTFGRPFDSLSIPTRILATPINQADPNLRALGERYLQHLERRYPLDTQRQVQELVGRQLANGGASIGSIAKSMMLHPRTLQRRLKAQGVRFEDLVEDLRRNRAEEYLGYGSIPLAQVALLVGYSGQNAFTLACKRWFGMTPRRVRNQYVLNVPRLESGASVRRASTTA